MIANKTAVTAAVVVAVGAALVAVVVVAAVLRSQRSSETRRAAIDGQTVVMFGDSITEQGDWDQLLTGHRISNHGYSGFTSDQLAPIARQVATDQPGAVYILAGTNDIRDGHPASWTSTRIATIVDIFAQQSPDTRIVLQTITPRADATQQVAAANQALAELAAERGIALLDIHTPLDDGTGGLRAQDTNDGLHLTSQGYDRWAAVLVQDLGAVG